MEQPPSSKNTREDSAHGHHQMVNTEIRLIIFLCIPVVLVVTSLFSFLILLIWALSHFFLMSLAKDLTALSFQRTIL